METIVSKRFISRAEYHQMWEQGIIGPEEKVELVNGEIVQKMSPVGSRHSFIVNSLVNKLIAFGNKDWWVISQSPIKINEVSEPEPDVAVVVDNKTDYKIDHPTAQDVHFLIEVSDSTLSYDQTTKKELYAVADIPTYWVVNLPFNQIEVFSHPVGQLYTELKVYGKGQQVPFPGKTEFLNVTDLLF